MNDVCSIELLTNAVANRLSADEESALYDHLERCEACCARMEQLAGGEQWQQEAAALLTTDELDAAVPELMVWSEVDFSVEHLEPSEDANVLGQLGGYDVLAIIGRGGMGVVLKAFDRELKRFVAIKALSPHLAHSSVARKRFAREAQAAAAVVNPHVIAIHHVQPTGRLPFLIMPLLTGETLAQRLKSRAPLELTEVLRIGMQAAVGLAAAHDQGLVHRDVKPANIFLEKGVERVVITDFGLARAADDVSMTRLGVVAGTPEYMSPEQARGEALDGRSDLFSLGCVLYEMATGVSPFRSDSTIATLRRIVDDKPAAIASLAPELPPWFSYIVESLQSKDPAQRFASASEVSQLLEACLSHLQQPTSVPLPASLVPHANTRRSIFNSSKKRILTMLGTLGTALLGMVLWQATEPPDISGQWTSDEWGNVVLEAKEPGQYEGTFGGNDKTGKPTTGNMPPEKEPFTAWGDEVGGLQAGLGLDYGNRRTYGHGEVITLVVRLRNVGKEAVKFTYLRQDLYENLAVTDADGEAVPQCNTKFMPPNDPESENLEPGKEIVLKTRMHGSNGVPFVLIPSNSEDLELNENFRPLVAGIGKVQLQIEKVFGTFSFDFPKLSTGTLELEVNNQPGGAEFSGSSSEIHPAGSPRASGVPPGSNKGESGTLHLKWSRLERRFNGTWGQGADRRGTMSLRLVDKEIRGGWTTNEDVQLETGTPLLGDLSWTRSAVPVPVGGTDLRGATTQLVDTPRLPVSVSEGGNVSAGEAVMTPLTIPPGDIGVDVYAGRGLWYSKDEEVFKLLHSVKSLRGVTFQVHEDGTGDAFTKAVVHDPVPVRAEPAENQKREERIRTLKIAIDESLRSYKVPNIRWLNANGKQQDGPVAPMPDTASTVCMFVEAWVTAVIAKDVKTASSLAKNYPARADQIEAWGNGWKLTDFSIGTVKTDEQSSPPRALVVSAKEVPVTLPVEGQPAASFLAFELKLLNDGWSITDVEPWDTVEHAVDHFLNGGPDVLRPMPVDTPNAVDRPIPSNVPDAVVDGPVPMGLRQPPTPANTDDSALSVVDETLKSLIESQKPLQGYWVVELPGPWFYPTDKLRDSAVSQFVMRIRGDHVELRPFPHSGEQPVSKLLLHPIQDAKPGHFLVDTDPSAVDQRFSPGEFSFEVQDNQLYVKLIPAKSSESNRPDQGSEAPKGFSARRETEGFSARRATDEEQRKFAQDRFQHTRMVGYKNSDRTNPEAVVEAYVAASLAGDVAIATCLAEGDAARPDQSTGWNKHWNLNDFAIKSVRVRGRVVTPMRVTAKEAIVVSELMHRTSPATIGDVSIGHHVAFLKNINGKWVISAFDLWTAEHYNKGIGNFLNADGEAIGVPQEDVEGTSEKSSAGHKSCPFCEIESKTIRQEIQANDSWTSELPAIEELDAYISAIRNLPDSATERFKFYWNHLEHKNEEIADDSSKELELALHEHWIANVRPFDFKPVVDLKQLRFWLKDPQVPEYRRRVYIHLLGVCGNDEDIEVLKRTIGNGVRENPNPNLEAQIEAYVLLGGLEAWDFVEQKCLQDDVSIPDTSIYSMIRAVRFLDTHSKVIPRDRLLQSLHFMLDRPALADIVVKELIRMEDWSQVRRLVDLLGSADEDSKWVRLPIVQYLQACPLPEAADELKKLREISKAVDRALQQSQKTSNTIPGTNAQ